MAFVFVDWVWPRASRTIVLRFQFPFRIMLSQVQPNNTLDIRFRFKKGSKTFLDRDRTVLSVLKSEILASNCLRSQRNNLRKYQQVSGQLNYVSNFCFVNSSVGIALPPTGSPAPSTSIGWPSINLLSFLVSKASDSSFYHARWNARYHKPAYTHWCIFHQERSLRTTSQFTARSGFAARQFGLNRSQRQGKLSSRYGPSSLYWSFCDPSGSWFFSHRINFSLEMDAPVSTLILRATMAKEN